MRGKRVKEDSISVEKIIIFIIIIIVIVMGIFVFKPRKEASKNTITDNGLNAQNQASVSNYSNTTKNTNTETDKQDDQILTIDNKSIWEGIHYNTGEILQLKDSSYIDKFSKAVLIECDENYDIIEAKMPIDITSSLKDKGYTFNETGIYLIQLFDKNNNEVKTNETNLRFIIE